MGRIRASRVKAENTRKTLTCMKVNRDDLVFSVHSCCTCTYSGLQGAGEGSETEVKVGVALLSETEILLSKILY